MTTGERAARLDGTPVGVLVGGKIVRAESDSTLTVGLTGQLLVGELAGSLPVQQADGLALLAEGAATDAAPLVTVATQSADSVLAAGLFQQTFAGVFDDLRARSTALAALPSTLQATDSAGSPLASFDGTQVHLTPTDGVNVWTVSATDLAGVQGISIEPAPTADAPLIINITGDAVSVAAPVTIAGDPDQAATETSLVVNIPTATTVEVSAPIEGSLLAPAAAVSIGADVLGSLVAASLEQTAPSVVTAVPFVGELSPADPADGTAARATPEAAPEVAAEAAPSAAAADSGIGVFARAAGDRQQRRDHREGWWGPGFDQRRQHAGRSDPAAVRRDDRSDHTGRRFLGQRACSDADGDCSFVVPNTQIGAPGSTGTAFLGRTDRRARRLVRNPSPLDRGCDTPLAATAYQFRTGTQLRAGATYALQRGQRQLHVGTGNENAVASGGIWQNSRMNPTLPAQCGLSVALIIDISGSVGAALPQPEDRGEDVRELTGRHPVPGRRCSPSPPTAPANTTNNQNRPLTSVSTAARCRHGERLDRRA